MLLDRVEHRTSISVDTKSDELLRREHKNGWLFEIAAARFAPFAGVSHFPELFPSRRSKDAKFEAMMKLSQEQINSLALRFKEAEWAWLTSLSDEEKSLIEGGSPEDFDPTSYTHYGEFFLTICGIKPCFLITNANFPQFGEFLFFRVLKPLMAELPGFEFFRVQHPLMHSRTTQVVYIFTSRHHPKFPLIQELLMKPQSHPIPAELLGKALGYPVPCGNSTFCYVDQTTTQELGVNCVVVFEFTARAGFERSIKMHFEKCAAEFRKLGKVLTISCQ